MNYFQIWFVNESYPVLENYKTGIVRVLVKCLTSDSALFSDTFNNVLY